MSCIFLTIFITSTTKKEKQPIGLSEYQKLFDMLKLYNPNLTNVSDGVMLYLESNNPQVNSLPERDLVLAYEVISNLETVEFKELSRRFCKLKADLIHFLKPDPDH